MLAYVDGVVAGWCGFGPRPRLPRLVNSRTIPAVDDRPVWAILCFNIRVGYRRQGVAQALLDGVVDYARRSGAPGVEAYPIDPEGSRVDVSFGFVGLTPMFDKAGFRRVTETAAHSDRRIRWLTRLDFDNR
jgi:GNAT superfamily N-acetyltransferase